MLDLRRHVVLLRKDDQALRIDETDVAEFLARNGTLARVGSNRLSMPQTVHSAGRGHQLTDRGFGFFPDFVDDVVDADGL